MSAPCPKCGKPLGDADGIFHCATCGEFKAVCPDCHQPLQILKACGATDFFCPDGHGLISKKRVEFAQLSG